MDTTQALETSPSPVAGPESLSTPPDSPASSSPPASEPGPSFREPPKSKQQQALERAKAKLSVKPNLPAGQAAPAPESLASEQAAPDGVSTPAGETPNDENGTSAPDAAASTPAPLDHWSPKLRDSFNAIPTAEGKEAMLEVYKGLQAPFTQGMQAIRAREQELNALVELQQAFERDPRSVIEQIATTAGVEVFFDRQAQGDEIPEFQDPRDLATWLDQRNAKRQALELAKQREEFQRSQAKDKAAMEFKAELEAAAGKYPDFVAHQAGILQTLHQWPDLPVERAYQLTTYAALAKKAAAAADFERQANELKSQLKTLQTNAMRPSAGANGEPKTNGEANLNPREAALMRAQRRLAAQRSQS